MKPSESKRGRPNSTTDEVLRDAAFELFQSEGYENTSVTDIARVAGVSRATFFNYFDAKSDVFWVEVDQVLAKLPAHLHDSTHSDELFARLQRGLTEAFETWDGGDVPWVFAQFELIGEPISVRESAAERVVAAHRVLEPHVRRMLPDSQDELRVQTVTSTVIAAVIAAIVSWAKSEPPRGNLVTFIDRALSPLSMGLLSRW